MSLRRLLVASSALVSFAVVGGAPAAVPELVFLDGKRAPVASVQRPVTVMLLWTSMCADPASPLKGFEALAGRYAKDARVASFSVSIDQAKNADDLAVIQEIVSPLKLQTPAASDSGFRVLGLVDGKDYGGKPPPQLQVPLIAVLRDGKVVHRGGFPSSGDPTEAVEHYVQVIDAELAKLPKVAVKRKKKS